MKAGKAIKPEDMYSSMPKYTAEYFGSSIGTRTYRQICVEIGKVYIGSEYQLRVEQEFDVLAAQASHTVQVACKEYAAEVGRHSGMPSDLLLRYGYVSEAWWEITGLAPNKPPMLPLHVHQGLKKYTQWSLGQEVPVAAFDLQDLKQELAAQLQEVKALNQELAVQLQEVKVSLQRDIQAATGHLGPALPSTPPPGSSFIGHEIADAIMASPPVVAPRYSRQERPNVFCHEEVEDDYDMSSSVSVAPALGEDVSRVSKSRVGNSRGKEARLHALPYEDHPPSIVGQGSDRFASGANYSGFSSLVQTMKSTGSGSAFHLKDKMIVDEEVRASKDVAGPIAQISSHSRNL